MKVVWVEGYKYIDNGVFLDGRSKTLEAHQQGGFHHSTDTGRKSTGSVKEERLRKNCKGMQAYG